MAKEWAKFEADYKKLKAQNADVTASNAKGVEQRFRMAGTTCTEGESNLRSSLNKARKAGVTGDSFADFMKNKDFQEGVKLLNTAASAMDAEMKRLDAFSAKAAAASDALLALKAAIEKDLKNRKDSSESKKDIEALQKTIEADVKALKPLTTLAKDKVAPYRRSYTKNFSATVAKILKEAPEAVRSQAEGNELPHKLTDRLLVGNLAKCVSAAKDVASLCESALKLAAKGDKAGAQGELKKAMARRKEGEVIAAEYQKIAKDYKSDVDNSKDKKKVVDAIARMAAADAQAERAVRGLAVTMKKAG